MYSQKCLAALVGLRTNITNMHGPVRAAYYFCVHQSEKSVLKNNYNIVRKAMCCLICVIA